MSAAGDGRGQGPGPFDKDVDDALANLDASPAAPFDAEMRALYPEIDQALQGLEKQGFEQRAAASAPALPVAQAAPPPAAGAPQAPPSGANPYGAQPPWGPWGWGPPPPGWAPPGWGPPPWAQQGGPPPPYPSQPYPQQPPPYPQSYPQGPPYPQAPPSYPQSYPQPAASVPGLPIPMPRAPQPPVAAAPAKILISLRDVTKKFERRGGETLTILSRLNLEIERGSFNALMGPSGSGKSTLLNIIAGLDSPTSGSIEIGGVRMGEMSDSRLTKWRADNIGFIYQQYNLIPVMTALENVELPLLLTSVKRSERRQRARTALRIVGLEERMDHFPKQLSGGQEQRVGIARAIVNDPAILLADEPTGDLDRKAADEILLVLEKLSRELGKTIVMVTHDPEAAARAFVQHHLDKGVIDG